MKEKSNPQNTSENIVVPEGYAIVIGNVGQRYIVPKFMIPATHQAFEAYQKKVELNVENAPGGGLYEHSARANNHFKSGNTQDIPYFSMGEDKVMSPHDPPLTDRECLGLHAEIKSLQERLGISYKDASHRLYMSELEKLKAEKDASKAFCQDRSGGTTWKIGSISHDADIHADNSTHWEYLDT
ncbi:hypothetical protein BYT27DRAFT_7207558 [Phlegmacium glaucopus]|nr:hypothetical protein BYT27DRAFT_7207558 [Phlegmacium glaucopus]